jgi:hypothetical protein
MRRAEEATMRSKNFAWFSIGAAAVTFACTNEVPIGQGQGGSAGAAGSTGAVGGSSGSGAGGSLGAVGGSAGVGTGGVGGVGGSGGVATGGVGGVGGAGGAATGGSAGAVGGSAGVGTGGAGGGPAACPSDDSLVTQKIAAPGISDVVVAEALYWSENQLTNSRIRRLASQGGVPEELASAAKYSAQSAAFEQADSMARDGQHLYWRTKEGRAIWRMPISGAEAPAQIASVSAIGFGTGAGQHDVLTVQGETVYWVQGPSPAGSNSGYKLYSAPKAGGTATELQSWQSSSSNPDLPFLPLSIDADATHVYVGLIAGPGASKLVQLGIDGSNPTDLFGIGHYLLELPGSVLMTGSGLLWRIPKSGGTAALVTQGLDKTQSVEFSQGIAEYAGNLYVGTHGTLGTLECCSCGWVWSAKASDTNGSIVPLWAGQGRPTALGVSPSFSGLAFADIDNDEVVVIDLLL